MKISTLLFLCLALPAFAGLDDDLIFRDGVKVTTARSLTWKGKVYGNVQIVEWTSAKVLLVSKQGALLVPFKECPKVWQAVMNKLRPPVPPSPAFTAWEAKKEAVLLSELAWAPASRAQIDEWCLKNPAPKS